MLLGGAVSALVASLVHGGGSDPSTAWRPRSARVRAETPPLIPGDAAEVLREVRWKGAKSVWVNVWATWCQPCREEMPDLLRLRREFKDRGFRLVLVSADFDTDAEAARRFLAELGVDFPTWIKTGPDMEFIDALAEKWSGALPATFAYDSNGSLRRFWEGKADYGSLRSRLLDMLGPAAVDAAAAVTQEAR